MPFCVPPDYRQSAQGLDLVHEAPHTIDVDRIPGIAIDLKMGTDDHAVGERKYFGRRCRY